MIQPANNTLVFKSANRNRDPANQLAGAYWTWEESVKVRVYEVVSTPKSCKCSFAFASRLDAHAYESQNIIPKVHRLIEPTFSLLKETPSLVQCLGMPLAGTSSPPGAAWAKVLEQMTRWDKNCVLFGG